MTFETIEKTFTDLKEEYTKFAEKKTYSGRTKIRKLLQQLKADAQNMRKEVLEEMK